MKEAIAVTSNALFAESDHTDGKFKIIPMIEIVIIHSDGKEYRIVKDELSSKAKLGESRFIISPSLLKKLIVELELHYKKACVWRENGDKINALIDHLETKEVE